MKSWEATFKLFQLQIYLELYLVCHLSPVDRLQSDDKDDGDQGEVAGNEHQEAGMIFAVAVASLQEVGIVV